MRLYQLIYRIFNKKKKKHLNPGKEFTRKPEAIDLVKCMREKKVKLH